MKNIVFTMDIDLAGEGRYASTRRLPYQYSIKSWVHPIRGLMDPVDYFSRRSLKSKFLNLNLKIES